MPSRGTRSRLPAVAATVLVLSLALTACSGAPGQESGGREDGGAANDSGPGLGSGQQAPGSAAQISSNVSARSADIAVDTAVTVRVADGTFDSVVMRAPGGKPVRGSFNVDKTAWTARTLLEPDTSYVVASRADDAEGLVARQRMPFATARLTLDEQTYPNLIPLDDETVGVGMPVIVQFDVPVADRAAFEQRMSVTSTPSQRGSWHWMNDSEAHWRPATYWKAGTHVDVHLALNSISAGNGIYGQTDRDIGFDIGHSLVMKANVKTDQMGVFVNGSMARTMPITGGKRGFETRRGTKLIVEKYASKRMDAATVGIERDDPEYYNIPRVEYAQRVTFTGEFLHAAPWSVSSQGVENVSHGCIGLSTENAAWLFKRTHRGDPIETIGTDRRLKDGNGWTDWNQSYAEWKQGSAL